MVTFKVKLISLFAQKVVYYFYVVQMCSQFDCCSSVPYVLIRINYFGYLFEPYILVSKID